ncbi:ABC transporter permease [Pedobacter panaciterrae]|jgi:ABC-type transport system, involved in lipoprotein release, permease component|uniref:ABC transporter permease n=1 Tax=Pedobacter panaciterrae TaxID=363849 RepID=UPI00155DADD3|nr:ABC transporter permease [Pedobacter panaciterrae]NQX56771.1 ABC transporter permease [Pedobacter panaciterrae]
MLKNYIKLTFKVMLRKKYYTALTLVGISLTLMVITVFASFLDQIVSANPPEIHRERTLILDKVSVYKGDKKTDAAPSISFLQKNIRALQSTETISYFTTREFISFLNGKTAGHILKFTDENFWKITDFEFLEGKPFNIIEVRKGARVAVISEKTKAYFFKDGAALGKTFPIQGIAYQVIGVVKPATPFSRIYSDVYVPYTTDVNTQRTEKALEGTYNALLLAKTNDLKKVRAELRGILKKANLVSGADSVKVHAFTALEQFAKSSSFNDDEPEYGKTAIVISIVLILFMLIPAISLVNINVTRIGERAEEIGIRKSFGATSGTLVGQLVTENIIITLIGGLIGLGLSIYASQLLVQFINTFDPLFKMPTDSFIISWRVFGFCLFSCLLLGLVSGIYPAWKMSRMDVVYALKGGNSL